MFLQNSLISKVFIKNFRSVFRSTVAHNQIQVPHIFHSRPLKMIKHISGTWSVLLMVNPLSKDFKVFMRFENESLTEHR